MKLKLKEKIHSKAPLSEMFRDVNITGEHP